MKYYDKHTTRTTTAQAAAAAVAGIHAGSTATEYIMLKLSKATRTNKQQ